MAQDFNRMYRDAGRTSAFKERLEPVQRGGRQASGYYNKDIRNDDNDAPVMKNRHAGIRTRGEETRVSGHYNRAIANDGYPRFVPVPAGQPTARPFEDRSSLPNQEGPNSLDQTNIYNQHFWPINEDSVGARDRNRYSHTQNNREGRYDRRTDAGQGVVTEPKPLIGRVIDWESGGRMSPRPELNRHRPGDGNTAARSADKAVLHAHPQVHRLKTLPPPAVAGYPTSRNDAMRFHDNWQTEHRGVDSNPKPSPPTDRNFHYNFNSKQAQSPPEPELTSIPEEAGAGEEVRSVPAAAEDGGQGYDFYVTNLSGKADNSGKLRLSWNDTILIVLAILCFLAALVVVIVLVEAV